MVVAAVDRVHGDGSLPSITLSFVSRIVGPSGRDLDGIFVYARDDAGEIFARSIRIRSAAPHRHFVALHEIGHFIDARGLPGLDFASLAAGVVDPWLEAISESRAFQRLRRQAVVMSGSDGDPSAALLDPAEPWARSYAQFVATRAGDRRLLSALDALRRHPSGLYWPRQWDDDDFAPIATAVELLFRRLGWIA